MKTISKLTHILLLLLFITTAVNAGAKDKSAANSTHSYFVKATELISRYFVAPRYVAGDYWGIGIIIKNDGGGTYEGSARCGLFNDHVYKPGYYIPGPVTVYINLTSSSYTGPLSATIATGQTSSPITYFTSTYAPTVTYTGCTPGYFGTAPNEVPVQLEGIAYQ